MENQQNLILIDWFTGTSSFDSVNDFIELLGMDDPTIAWEYKVAYMNGYPFRQSFGGIHILYGGREDMGVCLTMSGQGCRSFESYGHGDWFGLLAHFLESGCNITRFDLAYDDHSGALPLDQMLDDTIDHCYVSKSRFWQVVQGSTGTTIYHGSPQSKIRFRIYDKALERGLLDGTHWVRLEMQLRDKNAAAIVTEILTDLNVGRCFLGVLRNYLTYRVPSEDSNRSRWPIADYWQQLLDGVSIVRLWTAPGVDYNIFRLQRFLVDQCGAAILTWHDLYGLDDLLSQIKFKAPKIAPKYQKLLSDRGGSP